MYASYSLFFALACSLLIDGSPKTTPGRRVNEEQKLPTSGPAISRADGITESERYLKTLCDRTFLSLWSYPGVYRDQGRSGKGHGKEVCDLLVAFENHIIIFSDKDCAFR